MWAAGAAAVVAVLVLVAALGAPRPEVELASVRQATFVRYVEEDGRARVRDRYVISAPMAGYLERLAVEVGDAVEAEAVVATLRAAPSPLLDARTRTELEQQEGAAEAQLASGRAGEARAQAVLLQAARDLERARRLASAGTVTTVELEQAEQRHTVASRDLELAEQASHLAEHERARVRALLGRPGPGGAPGIALHAPVAGRVLRIWQQSEGVVAAGTPILEVGDPSALELVVDLLSTDAVHVRPGVMAEVRGWGGEEPIQARVRTVQPVATPRMSALGVEEERVDVILDPEGANPDFARVGDGYRVDVRVPVARLEDALVLPTGALFRVGERWWVFVADDGVVRRAPVEVASYGPLESAVAGGLELGAQVVVQPPETLEDGGKVRVRVGG